MSDIPDLESIRYRKLSAAPPVPQVYVEDIASRLYRRASASPEGVAALEARGGPAEAARQAFARERAGRARRAARRERALGQPSAVASDLAIAEVAGALPDPGLPGVEIPAPGVTGEPARVPEVLAGPVDTGPTLAPAPKITLDEPELEEELFEEVDLVEDVLLPIDRRVNEILGGDPGETISARVGRREGVVSSVIAEGLDLVDPGHTARALGNVPRNILWRVPDWLQARLAREMKRGRMPCMNPFGT